MTEKEAVEKDRESWKAVSKRLDLLCDVSSSKGSVKLRDCINALSEEIRKYLPVLKARVDAELVEDGAAPSG